MQTLNLEPLLGNENSVGKLAAIPKGNRGAKTFGSFSYENKEENSQFASPQVLGSSEEPKKLTFPLNVSN